MGLIDLLTGGKPVDKFAKALIDEMRRQAPDVDARYYAKDQSIVFEGGGAYVGRTFLDYRTLAPDAQAKMLVDYAADLIKQADGGEDLTFEEALPQLKPAIKNLTHLLNMEHGGATPHRLLAGPLCAMAVIDTPTQMHFVLETHLERWGVGFDEVLSVAIENLRAESPPKFTRHADGFLVSDYHDYFDASRLLLPELWRQLPVKGDPVAIAVERSILLVTGSEEHEPLRLMSQTAETNVETGHRSLAFTALVFRDGAWTPLTFDVLAEPDLQRAAVKQKLWDADVQQAALADRFKGERERTQIADLFTHEVDGRIFTFSQLRTDALLPQADVIVMPGPRGQGVMSRRWEDVEAVLGPFKPYEGTYPPRFWAEPPDEAQTARLAAEFATPEGFFEGGEGWVNFTRTR